MKKIWGSAATWAKRLQPEKSPATNEQKPAIRDTLGPAQKASTTFTRVGAVPRAPDPSYEPQTTLDLVTYVQAICDSLTEQDCQRKSAAWLTACAKLQAQCNAHHISPQGGLAQLHRRANDPVQGEAWDDALHRRMTNTAARLPPRIIDAEAPVACAMWLRLAADASDRNDFARLLACLRFVAMIRAGERASSKRPSTEDFYIDAAPDRGQQDREQTASLRTPYGEMLRSIAERIGATYARPRVPGKPSKPFKLPPCAPLERAIVLLVEAELGKPETRQKKLQGALWALDAEKACNPPLAEVVAVQIKAAANPGER